MNRMFNVSIRRSINIIRNNNINQTSLVLLRCLATQGGRLSGVVKWYNPVKGFGFITYKDGEQDTDIFVHQTVIKANGFRSLSDGESVEFDVAHENGKKFASNVTGIKFLILYYCIIYININIIWSFLGPGGAEVIGTKRQRRDE